LFHTFHYFNRGVIMRHFQVFPAVVFLGLVVLPAGSAFGQAYPSKLVRMLTSEAGGGSDLVARVIAQGLTTSLGQSVVVENRGGGVIAGEAVAKAAPDGHTLLLYGNTFWLMPLLRAHLSYDPFRDFVPITNAATTPTVLVVHPSMPVKSVKELVALAKARPGALNYASAATGTTNHLAAELLKYMTRTNIVRVGFKGHASAFNALLGGETHLMFAIVGPAMAQAKAGRARALAVTSAAPTPLAPELPTMAASGLPGFEVVFVAGIFAPAGTPSAIVTRLQAEIARVLERPESKDRLRNVAMETVGSTPDELAATIKAEYNVMAKVVKEAGIRDE
jgi:tripartite-type tricarboxylate transporter receptor subunit TctC